MAARTSPTDRQRRLGAEVRKMRMSAGVTAESAAAILGVDRGKISNIESGARPISPERIRTLAGACSSTDERFVDALADMARPSQRGWWEQYRTSLPHGLGDVAELESHAVRMRAAYAIHIPGLLQTTDHALALFRAVVPPLPEHEVAMRLTHRLQRQHVLEEPNPTPYICIVHEAALRMQFGGKTVARGQLYHLAKKAEQPNVRLLVIPFTAGVFPGAGQTVFYAEGPVPQLDTVQIDNSHGPDFLHSEDQLSKYRAHLDWMEQIALEPDQSRDFIHRIARQL
ncbi:helix-turn-helix transcriptional regulator [Streptomyces sp. ADI98-10]|uniref:helix-turn-helix domain-containing protein n=1 Tax=Streptomyces sp. ADI98-10 TaxID=1522763 RepID=UPI000F55141F|nr:helix-turn-helix transcriptional regulator [Streptomyces sp. ADI98-10]RPK92456.1 Helix-turn-helix protein [Streptomyces sp. ADI98-10]